MNKGELITSVAEKSGLTKKDAEAAVSAFIQTITDAVTEGVKVQITGFGSFERHESAERMGRNPKTNEPIKIPAKFSPKFKAGKEFKEKVNK